MPNHHTTTISRFRELAQQTVDNHLNELKTKYNNELPESNSLLKEAYANHRNILERELEEEKNKLISKNDTWLSGEIDLVKQEYLHQLGMAD